MPSSKLRRLFDIRPQHVSLVDRAANKREFLIFKREEKNGMTTEELELMKSVEKALNNVADRLEKLEEKSPVIDFEVDKKGARFSKDSLSALRGLKGTLDKLLDGATSDDDGKDKEDKVTKSDAINAIQEGIKKALHPDDDKKKQDEIVKNVVTELAKAIAEANKQDGTTE